VPTVHKQNLYLDLPINHKMISGVTDLYLPKFSPAQLARVMDSLPPARIYFRQSLPF